MDEFSSLADVYADVRDHMLDTAEKVDVGEWHAMNVAGNPALISYEWRNAVLQAPMPETEKQLQFELRPNLPWAEDHFQERVSGRPLNPPPSFEHWPWQSKMDDHRKMGAFSHSYPERIWPRYANSSEHRGIRYRYGDLNDLLAILARSPHTRQAYLPIWFPEDLAAAGQHQERVPCTLGYHFLLRAGKLHLTYLIRSCDLRRHFVDDVYLSIRLAQWMRTQLQGTHAAWRNAELGDFTFHCMSLHFFEGDKRSLEKERSRQRMMEARS